MQNSIETRGNLFTEPGPLVNNFLRLEVWREVYGFVIHWKLGDRLFISFN